MGVEAIMHNMEKAPQCLVQVAGMSLVAIDVHIANAYDSAMGTAEVELDPTYSSVIIPSAVRDQGIVIYQGYNGLLHKTFSGYVVNVVRGRAPRSQRLICRDEILLPSQDYLVDEITYGADTHSSAERQAEAVVEDFLTHSGVDASHQDLAVTNFTLCEVMPCTFIYKSSMDVVNEIATLIGWRCWADANGIVHFRYVEPTPADAAIWDYQAPDSGLVLGSRQGFCVEVSFDRGLTDLRNYVKVQGWTSTGCFVAVACEDSPYVPNPPRYWPAAVVSELIDTEPMATAIAARVLGDLNRLRNRLTIRVEGNPLLQVGQTVSITEPWTQHYNTNYFIFSIESWLNNEGYLMELSLVGGSPISSSGSSLAPVATFDYILEQEYYNGELVYVLLLDASGSYGLAGEIVSYEWSDGTDTKSGMYAKYIYDAKANKTVTLTVTDANGNTKSISQDITMVGAGATPVKARVLTIGCDDGVYTSLDGGVSWTQVALT